MRNKFKLGEKKFLGIIQHEWEVRIKNDGVERERQRQRRVVLSYFIYPFPYSSTI
jgi:hypothetical protein